MHLQVPKTAGQGLLRQARRGTFERIGARLSLALVLHARVQGRSAVLGIHKVERGAFSEGFYQAGCIDCVGQVVFDRQAHLDYRRLSILEFSHGFAPLSRSSVPLLKTPETKCRIEREKISAKYLLCKRFPVISED